MDKNELIEYIKTNFVGKDGRIKLKQTMFKRLQKCMIDDIIRYTSFLDITNPTFNNRIKALLVDIDSVEYCKCGKEKKRINVLGRYYADTCGDAKCISNKIVKSNAINNNLFYDKLYKKPNIDIFPILDINEINLIRTNVIQYIKAHNLYTISSINKINSIDKEIYLNIFRLTYYLNDANPSLNFRIKCILENVLELPKCRICKKNITRIISSGNYESNARFCYTCDNKKCVNSNKISERQKAALSSLSKYKDEFIDKILLINENIESFNNVIELNDLKNILTNFDVSTINPPSITSKVLDNNDILIKNILFYTQYFPKDEYAIRQRIYHILHNINDIPRCKICGNVLNFVGSENIAYSQYCNYKCNIIAEYKNVIDKLNENDYSLIYDGMPEDFRISTPILKQIRHNKCNNILNISLKSRLDSQYKNICRYCYPTNNTEGLSKPQDKLFEYIKSINKDLFVVKNSRILISPYELDIVIPSKKIAIEFNGNYWHSEEQGKDKNYHLNKTNMCNKVGYRLIHIFEDEWVNKEKIVKARLRNILGVTSRSIYARKCEVREISNNIKEKFLEKYHIQGSDKSSTKLGLFYKNRLVAVMTFGARRFDNKEGFELIRYATVANFNIIGGAGKLLAYFRNNFNKENLPIISYADRRWSEGNLYKQLGFTLLRETTSNYWYLDKDDTLNRMSRIVFQKHKLKDKLEKFDENLTEIENMRNNGYNRIFDCGNYVFEMK